MLNELNELAQALAPFADIGTGAPYVLEETDARSIRVVRNGIERLFSLGSEGSIIEEVSGETRIYANLPSLLASVDYAHLKKWALHQALSLKSDLPEHPIEIGAISENGEVGPAISIIEKFCLGENARLNLLLLDGPAGIGKTILLRSLAYERASNYIASQRPLILHIEGRGKTLQNIDDLIALNLQSLRAEVTFDQVPILIRHGLVTVAIDGFDELGDPNGYELAWAQIGEFINATRGRATIILAGRETFLSKETILRALPRVTSDDRVMTVEVKPVDPKSARTWLKTKGWTEETLGLDEVYELLSPESYALRPFFLIQLGQSGLPERISSGELDNLLSFVMQSLLERELTKFGENVERVVSAADLEAFIVALMVEVARDMAENQTDSISVTNLAWLSDVASEGFPEEIKGILRNRANVVAFLTQGSQRDRLRFIHENVSRFWLCKATLESLLAHELPKFVRRNIFNVDFLEILADQTTSLDSCELEEIISFCQTTCRTIGDADRTRRNLLAIVLAMLSTSTPSPPPTFSDIFLEEAFVTGTMSAAILKSVVISQLSARRCDFRNLSFVEGSRIFSLIVDSGSIPPKDLPAPSIMVLNANEISQPQEISDWIVSRSVDEVQNKELVERMGRTISSLPLFALLQKIVRFRRYWIKDDNSDKIARKILDDDHWPLLRETLSKHDLLVVSSSVEAAGRPANFFHLKNRDAFLDLRYPPPEVHPFLNDLLIASLDDLATES